MRNIAILHILALIIIYCKYRILVAMVYNAKCTADTYHKILKLFTLQFSTTVIIPKKVSNTSDSNTSSIYAYCV
jgi:hypothetical protein